MSEPMEVDWDDPGVTAEPPPKPSRLIERATRPQLPPAGAANALRDGNAQAALMAGNGAHPAGLGRSLPHSIEAEEYLLSCCLLDGQDVIRRCREAGIEPRSMYVPAHDMVLGVIYDLDARGAVVDASTLAEELKGRRQLDAVGGYAFITQVSSKIPTTAQATYFIEKVREQSVLRNLIRAATGAVENAYNYSGGGIDEFLAEQAARIQTANNGYVSGASDLATRAFDIKRLLPRPDPIFSVAGVTICTRGNLTTIYSQAKTGKSSFIGAMMGSTMTTPTSGHDTLGVTGPNYGKLAVLHFDTEQSPYDWQQLLRSTLRRVWLDEPPPWLMSYTIAGMEAAKAERFIQQAVRAAKKTHGGIHSIFIDGVADLVNDPNSPDECFPLVARLHGMAIEYDTAIVNILHLNPAAKDKTDKGRGHLGSQLERKCESNLTLKKDGDVTTVVAEGRQRGRPIPVDKSPAFRWSDTDQRHVSTTAAATGMKGRVPKHSFALFRAYVPGPTERPLTVAQIYKFASGVATIKASEFKELLNAECEAGALERSTDPVLGVCYRRAP